MSPSENRLRHINELWRGEKELVERANIYLFSVRIVRLCFNIFMVLNEKYLNFIPQKTAQTN